MLGPFLAMQSGQAGPQIRRVIAPAMLSSANVLDVKTKERRRLLRQLTILALSAGSMAHKLSGSCVHARRLFRGQNLARFAL